MTRAADDCGGHAGLSAEARALALTLLDRLGPVLDRVTAEQPDPAPAGTGTCTGCPVCALLAALRGERSELAVRLAEHTAGIVAVLRAALEEGQEGPAPAPEPPAAPAEGRSPAGRAVQRITVERVAGRR